MAFPTIGTAEALIHFLVAREEIAGKPADSRVVWKGIVHFETNGGARRFYGLSRYDAQSPADEFLRDIRYLELRGYIKNAGLVLEVTSSGRAFVAVSKLASGLAELREVIMVVD